MENGSFSLNMLRWEEVVVEVGVLDQNAFLSVGEGYRAALA